MDISPSRLYVEPPQGFMWNLMKTVKPLQRTTRTCPCAQRDHAQGLALQHLHSGARVEQLAHGAPLPQLPAAPREVTLLQRCSNIQLVRPYTNCSRKRKLHLRAEHPQSNQTRSRKRTNTDKHLKMVVPSLIKSRLLD